MKGTYTAGYLLFFAATLILRSRIRRRTLTAEKVPGTVVARWTSTYIFHVYIVLLFGSLAEYFLAQRQIVPGISACGAVLYAVGICGRQWSFRSLGKYWSIHIEIRDRHEIVTEGPYRYIRHPNYVFHSLEVIGLLLVPNAFVALLLFTVFYLPVLVYRAVAEERAMALHMPDEYDRYRRAVPAFLPFIKGVSAIHNK